MGWTPPSIEEASTTKGTCSSCEKTMAKAAMTRHVASCGRSEDGPQALLTSVCDRHAPGDYWLHLEVPTTRPCARSTGTCAICGLSAVAT